MSRTSIAVLATAVALCGGAAPAWAAWTTPETIALDHNSDQIDDLTLAFRNGQAVAMWVEGLFNGRLVYRPAAGPFGTPVAVDAAAVGSPAVAIGSGGQVTAAWTSTVSASPVVRYADLSGSSFGASQTLHASPGVTPADVNLAYDSTGHTVVTWSGEGTSGYRRIWTATRAPGAGTFPSSGAGAPITVTSGWSGPGNFEAYDTLMRMGSDDTATVVSGGVAQTPQNFVLGGRRAADGTWSFGQTNSTLWWFCCAGVQGATSLAVDGTGNSYFTVDSTGFDNISQTGPNLVYVKANGTRPLARMEPDPTYVGHASVGASDPQVVVDAAGNALMTWIRHIGSSPYSLYAAYRPAGDATTFGAPQLVLSGFTSSTGDRYRVAIDPSGNVWLVYKQTCTSSVCANLRAMVRAPGAASTFQDAGTIATNVDDGGDFALAIDPSDGRRMVIWHQEGASGTGLFFPLKAALSADPPASSAAPTMSGTPQQGQTLTCGQGTWTNAPTSYAYRWQRDGTDIGGATGSTYTPAAADVGHQVTCVVTATNAYGSASASSAAVTPTAAPATDPGGGGGGTIPGGGSPPGSGTPPGGGGTPAPAAPRITTTGRASTRTVHGRLDVTPGITVTCPAGGPACAAGAAVGTFGTARFTIRAGAARNLAITLSAKVSRTLRARHRVRVTVAVQARAGSGAPVSAIKQITIRT